MRVKEIVDEDFTNYRKSSMFVGTISCNGKCCYEAGIPLSVCQNDGWRSCAPISVPDEDLCVRYLKNDITHAIVFGGLEPFEQTSELIQFIETFRIKFKCEDDIVIYTGYYPNEIEYEVEQLKKFKNIIIKFGRFIPDQKSRYDEVLGITLASDNQFAQRIS